MRGEQRHGFFQRGGAGILEGRQFHERYAPSTALERLQGAATILAPAGPVNAAVQQLRYACRSMPPHASRRHENGPVELSMSVCNYDRTAALFDGRAPIEGCDVAAVRAGAGGVVPPRLQVPGVRRHRNLDEQLSADDGARRRALRRDPGLRVAAVPAQRHLHPHRPRHQNAAGPQGQDHRPAGIPDDRERLGARHAAGGIRREAARHQMAPRRAGGGGPRGARQDHAAAGDRPAGDAEGPHALRHAGEGRDRRTAQRAGAVDASCDGAPNVGAAVSELSGGRGGLFQEDQAVSDHARASASASRWWRSIRGSR